MSKQDYFISTDDLLTINENCNVYLFDRMHCFISCNNCQFDLFKKSANINSLDDVVGKSIKELTSPEAAEMVINENNLVMQTGKAQVFYNFIKFKTYKSIMFITLKIPLYDISRDIIGICGISVYVSAYDTSGQLTGCLSKKEYECLRHLLMGKTSKETALSMHLSPRTIEQYIVNIKNKFDCNSKSEIINKIFEIGLSAFLPLSDAISEPFGLGHFIPKHDDFSKK